MAKVRIIKHDGGVLEYTGSNEVVQTYVDSFQKFQNASGPNILRINFVDRAQKPDIISMDLIADVQVELD